MKFHCLNCGETFEITNEKCAECGWELPTTSGISATISEGRPIKKWKPVLKHHGQTGLESAIRTVDSHRDEDVELFSYGHENWRLFLSTDLDGRCLDLFCGTGRRAKVFSEQFDSVVAVDPVLDNVRLTDMRETSGEIVTVHGSVSTISPASNSFEIIIVDIARGVASGAKIDDIFSLVEKGLQCDGQAVLLVDGLPEMLSTEPVKSLSRLKGFFNLYKRIDNSPLVWDKTIVLYPESSSSDFTFIYGENKIEEWFLSNLLQPQTVQERILSRVANILHQMNLMNKMYPGYAIVLSDNASSSELPIEDTVVSPTKKKDRGNHQIPPNSVILRGRYRSTVLVIEEDITNVLKIPNIQKYGKYNKRSATVRTFVRKNNPTIASTVPEAKTFETRFGTVLQEPPATGIPLVRKLDGSVQSFESVLKAGFQWLTDLQSAFTSNRVQRTIDDIYDDFLTDGIDININGSGKTFSSFKSPVHGDFNQINIFAEGDGISTVTDWEYARCSDSPLIDPTNFLVTLIERSFDDFIPGVKTVLSEDSEYNKIVTCEVESYCREVGIPTNVFYQCLPLGIMHRIRVNQEELTELSLTTIPEKWTDRCAHLTRIVEKGVYYG